MSTPSPHYAYVVIENAKVIMIRFHGGRVDTDDATDEAWKADSHDELQDDALEFWAGKNRTKAGALEMLKKCGFKVYFNIDGVETGESH